MTSSTDDKGGEVDMCEYVRYFCSTVAVNLLVLVAFIGTPPTLDTWRIPGAPITPPPPHIAQASATRTVS